MRKAKMFDPTSRADVTVTSVRDSVCGKRRSAVSIQTKCVWYQNSLCCDGVEILQLETVSCVCVHMRYFWAAVSNALCVCVHMRSEIPAGWWPCRLTGLLQDVVWSLLVVSFEGRERCVGGIHLSAVVTFSLSACRRKRTRAPCSIRVKLSHWTSTHSVLEAHFEIWEFYLLCTHMEMDGRMGGGGGGGDGAATALVVINRKLKERTEAVSYM